MTDDTAIYDKLKRMIEESGYIISSEGIHNDQMYLTAYDKNSTRVQINVRNKIAPPIRLKKKLSAKTE